MSIYPDLPYVEADSNGGLRASTQMIVIHATDDTGTAADEAHYATVRTDDVSAHFYTDDTETIQALDTDLIAYGCYPIGNSLSVQFELCGLSNQISDETMRQAAPIVARACAQYGIPMVKISSAQLVDGVKGICGHADVTAAWNQGNHTDPGANFPWDTFIGYVVDSSTGDDMEQTDKLIAPTQNPTRTVGNVLADLSNLRDYLLGQISDPAGPSTLAVSPTSPLGKIVSLSNQTNVAGASVDINALATALVPLMVNELAKRLAS